MAAKQTTILFVCDNIDELKNYGDDTIAESLIYISNNDGTFDNWDDEEEGMTIDDFTSWEKSTYNFSAEAENAEEWIANIKYNEL